eukprot:TRINITY_DN58515_c0_g1_i1.p1 TRINITY_DN58515_c0_g1~~TRINITY_DN58515_c0_g1_i1.p1  ORF type:complete len:505 (+),score=94.51 TRINITY_DN58515_c0_g1_i1:37-1551(+)
MRLISSNALHAAAQQLFFDADQTACCQFVKIAGPTRSGKSTFANQLVGETVFTTSDSAEPCTQGVDCSTFFPLPSLAERSGCPSAQVPRLLTCVMDIEGGGDRDMRHDVRNYLPGFLLPGVVIWNVIGHPPRHELLNQLGVVARVGQLLRPATSLEESQEALFPNDLIIVIRDYELTSSASQILQRYLQPEPETPGDLGASDRAERNLTRELLKPAFRSIEVVLLPPRSKPSFRDAERQLVSQIVDKLTRNPLRLTSRMCYDLLCNLTAQIEAEPEAVCVGSALAYINLCEYNRRLKKATEGLARQFTEWFEASRTITNESDARRHFGQLADTMWQTVLADSAEAIGDDGSGTRKQKFMQDVQSQILDVRLLELRLVLAERQLTALQVMQSDAEKQREEQRLRQRQQAEAAEMRPKLSGAPNGQDFSGLLLAYLGNSSSFEQYYYENNVDRIVERIVSQAPGKDVSASALSIDEVLTAEMVASDVIARNMGPLLVGEPGATWFH